MKTPLRRAGALVTSILIASALLFALNHLSTTDTEACHGDDGHVLCTFDPTNTISLSNTAALANPNNITGFGLTIGDHNFGGSGAALITFLPPPPGASPPTTTTAVPPQGPSSPPPGIPCPWAL